ncbi:MAG TPA: glycosyltransferase [Natronosporangium sp.]
MLSNAPAWRIGVCALDRDGLPYGPDVVGVIRQDEPADYREAARKLAADGTDLVSIQHEYGIFGGPDGDYVLEFADELVKLGLPYVVTLHTVLSKPAPGQAEVLSQLCRHAVRVTVFTETARRIAGQAGYADPDRLVVIPHGVPVSLREPVEPDQVGPELRAALSAVAGHTVLSTFGLLRPGKGLETAIAALPQVVAKHPDVRYVIAGATHPEIARVSGEEYRTQLIDQARALGVGDQVLFVDAFLTEPELAVLLARTNIYLTPYKLEQQTCSGALTFALAAGCPVVSTEYKYAVDLVTPPDGPARGTLVPFDDPTAFATAINDLLDDPVRLANVREAAGKLGAELTWPAVGARFAAVFAGAVPAGRARSSMRMRPARLSELVEGSQGTQTAGGEPVWAPHRQRPASANPAP